MESQIVSTSTSQTTSGLHQNELDSWLDQLEAAAPTHPSISSSNPATLVALLLARESISKSGRVIITSADEKSQAYSSVKGAIFSDFFLDALDNDSTLFHSYAAGLWAAKQTRPWQSPNVDANGNGVVNEQDDYILASRRGLLYDRSKGPRPLDGGTDGANWGQPLIVNINNTRIEDDRCIIEAIIRDDIKIRAAWAIIYEPSFAMPENDGSLGTDRGVSVNLNIDPELLVDQAEKPDLNSDTDSDRSADTIIPLTELGNDRYRAERKCVQKGRYRIVVNADDEEGNKAPPVGDYLFNYGVLFAFYTKIIQDCDSAYV